MMGMPFRSEKQRRYMFANEPEIAERWTKKYGSKPVGVKKAVVMRPSPGTSTFSSAVLPALRERRKKPYQYIMSPGRAGSQKIQERIERRIKDPKIISESMEDPYQGSLELAEFLASRGLFDDMSVDDRLYLQSYLSRPGETYAASKKDVAAAMPERRRNQLFMRPRDLGVVYQVMNNPRVESGRGIMPITITPANPNKPIQPTYAYTGAPIGSSTIPSKVQAALMENYEDLIQPPSSIYDVRTGEPMALAFRLLKERKSPEAMRRKLEYDKQYEKTPERRKYQRELHAERRKRGIYGTGDHMDVSHTQGGRLTLEPEHANRARHFKDRGTLRVV